MEHPYRYEEEGIGLNRFNSMEHPYRYEEEGIGLNRFNSMEHPYRYDETVGSKRHRSSYETVWSRLNSSYSDLEFLPNCILLKYKTLICIFHLTVYSPNGKFYFSHNIYSYFVTFVHI